MYSKIKVNTYICAYIFIDVCVYSRIYLSIYLCVCVCVCVCVCKYAYKCVNKNTPMYKDVGICLYIYIYICFSLEG